MEQIKNNDQQGTLLNETDYIDIPAFFRNMLRYARKYILLVVPLIICMSLGMAVLSKSSTEKYYVAGGTSMIGVRLSGSLSYDYTLSGLTWDRQSTLTRMNDILSALSESGYLTQFVKESMGLKKTDELNGFIIINTAYSTNLVDISVASDSEEDAIAIRDAVFSCFPEAVFPALGFIEMDIQEMYTREESSSKPLLASPKIWVAGGIVLGIAGYLGLIFLFTLARKTVSTPDDVHKYTDLPCLGRLPVRKKRIRFRKRSNTEGQNDIFLMTEEYQQAFKKCRRSLSEQIRERRIKVLLLTGSGHKKGQSTIAAELQQTWLKMGKKVIVTDLGLRDESMTEERARSFLNQSLKEADLILIDGPSCDQSADALIFADCADAMIVVIREGESRPDQIKEMFQSLQYVNASSLGYVLTFCSKI